MGYKVIGCLDSTGSNENSVVATFAYVLKKTAADPTGNTATNTVVKSGAAIGAFTSTNAVNVCYRTGSTAPTCNADGTCGSNSTNQASTPVPAMGTAAITYKVIGCANSGAGHQDSNVVTFTYNLKAADVTGTASGTIASGTSLNAFASAGSANVGYRTDGSAPTCNADGTCGSSSTNQGSTAVPAMGNAAITYKVIGCLDSQGSNENSVVATFAYTPPNTAADPTGNTATNTAVKSGAAIGAVTSTNAVNVCYRTGSTAPTCNADGTCGSNSTNQASTPVPAMGTAAITYKVIGCANSGAGHQDSNVVTFTYNLKMGDVTGTASSTIASGTSLNAFASAGSLRICYRTDGTAPTCANNGTSCGTGSTDQASTAVPAMGNADITYKVIGCLDSTGSNENSVVATFAYSIAPTATTTVPPVAAPEKVVKQKLEFTGLTKAEADSKKQEIEGDIAKSLGVSASDVTILSIKEVDTRRRRLLAKKLVIEYEVKAKDDAAANALKTKMKGTAFKDSVTTKVGATTGKTITVVAKDPVVADAPATATTAAPKKGVVSMGAVTLPSALTCAIALLISTVL